MKTSKRSDGFNEEDSAALFLVDDPFGRLTRNLYRDNIFAACANVVAEGQAALWEAARPAGNVFPNA